MTKFFSTSTLIVALIALFTSVTMADEVLIKGSDTLLNLVQQLSEAYMKEHPDAEISVVGGGSGVGIAGLIDGTINVANASRKIKDEEVAKAKGNNINPLEIVIAIDGLAIIVNPENTIEKLTVEQLGRIYRGEVKNWKEVDGPDMKINLYGRQPSSGTYVFFMEHVLAGEYSQEMLQMAGNAQIVESVKQDKGGIGYVGLGYVKGVKGIKVLSIGQRKDDEPIKYVSPMIFLTPVKPGQKEPEASDYPLTRLLFQYTNGTPTGTAQDFIKFELSKKGQDIVEKVGFLRLSESQISRYLRIAERGRRR